tara:strand:- start:304 stop:1191 length:888 start_codon:yes stop_codon:yes gene_type:complete
MSRISDLAGFTTALSTTQDLSVGVITATTFSGDGSGLTGVASTDNIQTATEANFLSGVKITGVTTASGGVVGNVTGDVTGDLTGNADTATTATNAQGLTGTPNISIGSLTAASGVVSGNLSIGGTLTYQDVTNMDVLGIGTFQQGIQVLANGVNVTGIVTVGAATSITDGAISATRFHGDGSNLTGISVGLSTASASPNNVIVFLDLSNAQDHKVIASGITTISCTGGNEGESHTIRITNSGITTIGFTTAFLFPSGSSPVMPTADGAKSLISFTINKAGTAGTELFAGASVNFS